jgi:hypothetical protein
VGLRLYRLGCWRLHDGSHGGVDLRFKHLSKRRIEDSLREGRDVIWYSFANKEHGEVVGEVVAVVRKEIIGLDRLSA